VRKNLRRRFWFEIGSAVMTGSLAIITALLPDWIELVSGWGPDQHDGSLEQLLVAGLFLATIAVFALAAMEWRRTLVGDGSDGVYATTIGNAP